MTVKEMINVLKAQGHQVSFRKRSDGSYLITRLDGVSYKLAKGNAKAREILGVTLSERRAKQLERIAPPKKVAPSKRKIQETLSKEMLKELRRVQRIRRKEGANGQIGKRGLRAILREEGEDAVFEYLKQSERTARGYARYDSIDALQQRIESWKSISQIPSSWEKVINLIQEKREVFLEAWIAPINDIMYELERDVSRSLKEDMNFDSKIIEGDAVASIKAILLELY